MDNKNFDFNKTRDALSQLSTDLIELESVIKIKSSQIKENNEKNSNLLAEKEQKIVARLENFLRKLISFLLPYGNIVLKKSEIVAFD